MDRPAFVKFEGGELGRIRGLPDNRDCLASRIDKLIERWNDWSNFSQRTDAENYIRGDLKFSLEYIERRGFILPSCSIGMAPLNGQLNVQLLKETPFLIMRGKSGIIA